VLLAGTAGGDAVVEGSTPLRRLNYFDGKFLRADDLRLDQTYFRQLAFLGNQAGGPGVVRGFDVDRGDGDALVVSGGLAIDPQGRVLLLQGAHTVSVRELLELATRGTTQPAPQPVVRPMWWADRLSTTTRLAANPGSIARLADPRLAESAVTLTRVGFEPCEPTSGAPTVSVQEGTAFWIVALAHAEALCGTENVYGKLCEDACVGSTQRPYVLEGVVIRLRPLPLAVPLATSSQVTLARRHLRSRVASAWFETERREIANLISAAGLGSELWCRGAWGVSGNDVPIGVLARAGDETVFLDPWIVRRERMDTPPRRYWAWRMAMRPWDVFLAQILQFQCQLHELMHDDPRGEDPCNDQRGALVDTVAYLRDVERDYTRYVGEIAATPRATAFALPGGAERLASLAELIGRRAAARPLLPQSRILIDGGIVETPSAGYLPVDPRSNRTVNDQVRALLGDGVDLRFCVVRPDYVPHALEEAQHMERISLIDGLDHPERKPRVDVLVPDGIIVRTAAPASGLAFDATVVLPTAMVAPESAVNRVTSTFSLRGVARPESLAGGGGAMHFAGALESVSARVPLAAWSTMRSEHDPFAMTAGAATPANAELILAQPGTDGAFRRWQLWGTLTIEQAATAAGPDTRVTARFAGTMLQQMADPGAALTESSSDVRATVTLTRGTGVAGVRTMRITIDQGGRSFGFAIDAQWGGSPMTATAAVRASTTRITDTGGLQPSIVLQPAAATLVASAPIASASLREDRTVLAVEHALHARAVTAIEMIGASFTARGRDGDAFADAAQAALFPPAPAPLRDLIVRATRDWVLFHRRRERECATVTEAPPSAPPRRYRVFHVPLKTRELLGSLREGLAGSPVLSRFALQPVDTVEFAGGSATLTSNADAVRTDWTAVMPGKEIVYGAVATPPAVDPATLATSRLTRVVDTLATVTPFDSATGTIEALASVPATLETPGTDGVIVLATFTEVVATTGIAVYRVEPSSVDRMQKFLDGDDLATVLAGAQGVQKARLIEVASFTGPTPTPAPDAGRLRTRWDGAGDCPPAISHLFQVANDPNAGDNALRTTRARNIEQLLGAQAPDAPKLHPVVTTPPAGIPAGCSIVDIVVPQFIAYRAYAIITDGEADTQRWIDRGAGFLKLRTFTPRWEGFAFVVPGDVKVLEITMAAAPTGFPPTPKVVRPLLLVDPSHRRAEKAAMREPQLKEMQGRIPLPGPFGGATVIEMPQPTTATARALWPEEAGGVVIFLVQA